MSAHSDFSDQELLVLLADGDHAAFAEVYARYWNGLYHTAFGILRQEDIAQDIVQEVFIDLWNRRQAAGIKALKPYLHQAARFQVLKAIRAGKVDQSFYERVARITVRISDTDPVQFKELQEIINGLLESLPDNCREVFRLSREEHMTYAEIALRLDISVKTVEKRMSLALRHFRVGLDGSLPLLIFFLAVHPAALPF
jgi:RNA polymerase sigma-70 factor (family 1)